MEPARNKNYKLSPVSLPAVLMLLAGCAALPSENDSAPHPALTGAGLSSEAAEKPPAAAGAPETRAHADLWERIRAGYRLPPLDSPYTARHEKWFSGNPEYLENMVARARFYLYYIVEEVERRGMPLEIALLPAIESAYQPHAYSRARAVGLWQFIAPTGKLYGLKMNWWYDGRRDVIASTQAALDYLEKLLNDFNGDWHLALAAYNCGEGKVARLMELNRRKGLATDYQHLKLPRETQHYVPKLVAMANIVADPERYGLKLESIPDSPYFMRVDTDSQIDLGVVARLTDLPVTELYRINPGYSRWVTDPDGPHALLVPADKKDILLEGLSTLPEDERVQWARHEVKRGETMGHVAKRYQVTPEAIRSANQLSGNALRLGQDLLIPASTSRPAQVSPAPEPPPASASRGLVRVVHRVRSGETLWSIARKYNVYVHQLKQWNTLGDGILKLGQQLDVWTRSGATAAALAHHPPG